MMHGPRNHDDARLAQFWRVTLRQNEVFSSCTLFGEQYLEVQRSYNQTTTVVLNHVRVPEVELVGLCLSYKYSCGLVKTTLDLQVGASGCTSGILRSPSSHRIEPDIRSDSMSTAHAIQPGPPK